MKEPKKPAPPVTSTRRVAQKLERPPLLILKSYTKVPGSPPYPNCEQHVPEKPEPGAAVEESAKGPGRGPPRGIRAGRRDARFAPAAIGHQAHEGGPQDARGIVGVERADGEAVGVEERAQLGASESELVELAARGAHPAIAPGEGGPGQPAQAIPVRHRHEDGPPACQHARGLRED